MRGKGKEKGSRGERERKREVGEERKNEVEVRKQNRGNKRGSSGEEERKVSHQKPQGKKKKFIKITWFFFIFISNSRCLQVRHALLPQEPKAANE